MINVQQISNYLARLQPDSAVQKYAALHKDDPYIMALALSEANRRKAAKTAQHLNAPEQPKVVDQAVASMASPMPEDVGIAQLPTGEMEYAAGGIVAFDEGGEVPRFNGETGSYLFPEGSLLGQFQRGQLSLPEGALLGTTERARQLQAQQIEEERRRQEIRNAAFRTAAAAQEAAATQTVLPTAATPASAAATGRSQPGPRTTPQPGPRPAPQAATAPAQQPGGIGDLQRLYGDIFAQQTYTDPAAARLTTLETKERTAAEAEKAALERDQARFAEAFKGREERLGKREAAIGEQKDINTGLAFLNAGLAVMSTPGGLATALGKGAQVGTAQFAAGLDKIRSAQEKLDEARDRMEELRLNRDEMNAKEIRAAESKIRQTGIDAEKRSIDGLRQAAGVTEARAKEIFGKTVQLQGTREEIAGRERAAQISAGAQLAVLRAVAADPKLQAVYGKGQGQAKIMDEFNDFMKANPQYLTNESAGLQAFLRIKGALSPLSGVGAAGTVSTQPTGPVLK